MNREEYENKQETLEALNDALRHVDEALYELDEVDTIFLRVDIDVDIELGYAIRQVRNVENTIEDAASALMSELKNVTVEDEEDNSYMEDQPKLPGMEEM